MPAEKPHSVRFSTYGIQSWGGRQKSVTRDFRIEEEAVAFMLQQLMTAPAGAITKAIIARVEKWPVEGAYGKFNEIPSVVLRFGGGVGWWEAPDAGKGS